jgi:eukaryotic-like serine/threonine-protein kinase
VLCYTPRPTEPNMTQERWQKLQELCHLALEREPSQRALFLAEACRDDEALRRDAESLLARATIDAATLDDPPDELEAKVIGHYHLLQKIGEGGMGEVWLAEQKEPVRRRVALKLVKAGMNTREVIGRFESERQTLALMEHPAIAKVFDAGSTPDGAPYFAMEYVAGVPITEYCDNHRLPIKERLELFMHVCEGVRHAHQKAVIHRDLKPSNILVTEVDGKATPKIIDFGVAKALGQKLSLDTIFTRVGSLVGTPEYMSPEQALSSGEDVDTRTDVYSLGIVFYELLAGAPPIELRRLAFDEYLRRLREEDPPKPSTKIRTGDPATKTELARRRQTEPVALARQIGGDLDSIALKALEKDRGRRYGSAADFAADIGRYLRDEAVQAVAPSAAYRARKFASRHRWGVVMACAFVVVLTTAAAISIRQSIRANREAAVAQAVSDFLRNDVLAQAGASTQASPTTKPDPDLKVRTALDRAAAAISGKFDKHPEVEAAIRDTIGEAYLDLGLYPEARTQLQRARELHSRIRGPEASETLLDANGLGLIALHQAKYSEAESLLTRTVDAERRTLGSEDRHTLLSMNNLGLVYQSEAKYSQAQALFEQLVQSWRRVQGPDDHYTLMAMTNLGSVYEFQGKYSQAESVTKQALEIQRRVLGPEHPDTLLNSNNLGIIYNDEGKYQQAAELLRQTLEIQRRVLGSDHVDTLNCMINLAISYGSEGKYADAEELQRETLEIERRVFGPEYPNTLIAMENLADILELRGKHAEAIELLTQTWDKGRHVWGPNHPVALTILSDLAFAYQMRGKYANAEACATQVLAGRRKALGSAHPFTMASAADLALAYVSQKKFAEAQPLAQETLDFWKKSQPGDWQQFRAESLLGACFAGQKKYAEAEPLLLGGYQGMLARKDRMGAPDLPNLDHAHEWLVQMYVAWGKPDKAAEWRKK